MLQLDNQLDYIQLDNQLDYIQLDNQLDYILINNKIIILKSLEFSFLYSIA